MSNIGIKIQWTKMLSNYQWGVLKWCWSYRGEYKFNDFLFIYFFLFLFIFIYFLNSQGFFEHDMPITIYNILSIVFISPTVLVLSVITLFIFCQTFTLIADSVSGRPIGEEKKRVDFATRSEIWFRIGISSQPSLKRDKYQERVAPVSPNHMRQWIDLNNK